MTLSKHVFAVKNTLSRGVSSKDFSFSNRLIAHHLQVSRALLTERKADKYHFISEQSYQSLCITLELSQFHNCCDMPDSKCKVLKSTIEIPKFLNTRWGNFLKVMDLEGNVIPEISKTSERLSVFGLVPQQEGWFMHDNRLYIVKTKVLVKVLLNALFDDPEAVHEMNCASTPENGCTDFMDVPFPIDSDLVDPMYTLTEQRLMRAYSIPQDRENDGADIQGVQQR